MSDLFFAILFPATLGIIGVAGFVYAVWGQKCNHKTAAHRRAMIDVMYDCIVIEERQRLIDEYDAVSHEQHLRALMMRRDPLKLYGKTIQDYMQGRLK